LTEPALPLSPFVPQPPLPLPLVLLDLETTGAHPERDQIIEVALTRYDPGAPPLRWERLIQPSVPIPPLIERLIGITNEMVSAAPPFAAIADELLALLEGAVLAAHNVRFDYGFLRQAFTACGRTYTAPLFCTVKFAKALEPNERRHGLDALIERHGFTCPARHRARADVAVLEQYLAYAQRTWPAEQLLIAREAAMRHPARPAGLAEGVIEAIPETPGVYLFFGENDLPLYIGKSKALRSRVTAHFSAATRHPADAEIARQIRRLDWIETAGDLHAQLVEAELIQRLKPRYNKRLRANQAAVAIEVTGVVLAHGATPPQGPLPSTPRRPLQPPSANRIPYLLLPTAYAPHSPSPTDRSKGAIRAPGRPPPLAPSPTANRPNGPCKPLPATTASARCGLAGNRSPGAHARLTSLATVAAGARAKNQRPNTTAGLLPR
jgi:DNA polymerase III epsilon subunit family exonuclease